MRGLGQPTRRGGGGGRKILLSERSEGTGIGVRLLSMGEVVYTLMGK